jgi:hypothetical protein
MGRKFTSFLSNIIKHFSTRVSLLLKIFCKPTPDICRHSRDHPPFAWRPPSHTKHSINLHSHCPLHFQGVTFLFVARGALVLTRPQTGMAPCIFHWRFCSHWRLPMKGAEHIGNAIICSSIKKQDERKQRNFAWDNKYFTVETFCRKKSYASDFHDRLQIDPAACLIVHSVRRPPGASEIKRQIEIISWKISHWQAAKLLKFWNDIYFLLI